MKSKSNKRKLACVLGTFNLGEITTMKTGDDGTFRYNEPGVTIVREAAKSDQSVIPILSDGKDVFVLLAYWVNRADMQCKVWSPGIDQNLTTMLPVLTLVCNTYSY